MTWNGNPAALIGKEMIIVKRGSSLVAKILHYDSKTQRYTLSYNDDTCELMDRMTVYRHIEKTRTSYTKRNIPIIGPVNQPLERIFDAIVVPALIKLGWQLRNDTVKNRTYYIRPFYGNTHTPRPNQVFESRDALLAFIDSDKTLRRQCLPSNYHGAFYQANQRGNTTRNAGTTWSATNTSSSGPMPSNQFPNSNLASGFSRYPSKGSVPAAIPSTRPINMGQMGYNNSGYAHHGNNTNRLSMSGLAADESFQPSVWRQSPQQAPARQDATYPQPHVPSGTQNSRFNMADFMSTPSSSSSSGMFRPQTPSGWMMPSNRAPSESASLQALHNSPSIYEPCQDQPPFYHGGSSFRHMSSLSSTHSMKMSGIHSTLQAPMNEYVPITTSGLIEKKDSLQFSPQYMNQFGFELRMFRNQYPNEAFVNTRRYTSPERKEMYRELGVLFYLRYAPMKVPDVDTILSHFVNREDVFLRELKLKYSPNDNRIWEDLHKSWIKKTLSKERRLYKETKEALLRCTTCYRQCRNSSELDYHTKKHTLSREHEVSRVLNGIVGVISIDGYQHADEEEGENGIKRKASSELRLSKKKNIKIRCKESACKTDPSKKPGRGRPKKYYTKKMRLQNSIDNALATVNVPPPKFVIPRICALQHLSQESKFVKKVDTCHENINCRAWPTFYCTVCKLWRHYLCFGHRGLGSQNKTICTNCTKDTSIAVEQVVSKPITVYTTGKDYFAATESTNVSRNQSRSAQHLEENITNIKWAAVESRYEIQVWEKLCREANQKHIQEFVFSEMITFYDNDSHAEFPVGMKPSVLLTEPTVNPVFDELMGALLGEEVSQKVCSVCKEFARYNSAFCSDACGVRFASTYTRESMEAAKEADDLLNADNVPHRKWNFDSALLVNVNNVMALSKAVGNTNSVAFLKTVDTLFRRQEELRNQMNIVDADIMSSNEQMKAARLELEKAEEKEFNSETTYVPYVAAGEPLLDEEMLFAPHMRVDAFDLRTYEWKLGTVVSVHKKRGVQVQLPDKKTWVQPPYVTSPGTHTDATPLSDSELQKRFLLKVLAEEFLYIQLASSVDTAISTEQEENGCVLAAKIKVSSSNMRDIVIFKRVTAEDTTEPLKKLLDAKVLGRQDLINLFIKLDDEASVIYQQQRNMLKAMVL